MKVIKNSLIKLTLISVVFSLSLSCQSENFEKILHDVNEPFNIIQEEYAVFRFLLKDKPRNFVVLYGSPDEAFGLKQGFFEEEFPELQTDTLDSYMDRNKMPFTLYERPVDFHYPVVSKKDSKKKLERQYQYYEFSSVGFSKDGKQAFVHFLYVCNVLCSKGAYYLLQKEDNNWKIKKELISLRS